MQALHIDITILFFIKLSIKMDTSLNTLTGTVASQSNKRKLDAFLDGEADSTEVGENIARQSPATNFGKQKKSHMHFFLVNCCCIVHTSIGYLLFAILLNILCLPFFALI